MSLHEGVPRERDQDDPSRSSALRRDPRPHGAGLPEAFHVEIRPARERVVVVPHGELDMATVEDLARDIDELVATGFGEIVIDLRQLSFMDSTGLRLMVGQARRPDATVRLIDGVGTVARLFDLTGLRDVLPFVQP
jgi:anti-anti-sigma factor